MEGSGVEFEANDGKYEDGKGDEEANLSENTSRDDKEKDGESEFTCIRGASALKMDFRTTCKPYG